VRAPLGLAVAHSWVSLIHLHACAHRSPSSWQSSEQKARQLSLQLRYPDWLLWMSEHCALHWGRQICAHESEIRPHLREQPYLS
jgi:hypothetical protein